MAAGKLPKDKDTPTGRTVHATVRNPDVTKRIAELKKSARQAIGYAPTFLFEFPGDEVSGKIVDFREGIGQYESSLCILDRGAEPPVSVWLSADLGMKINKEHLGSFVTIVYVEDIDTGSGNPMHVYEVFFT